MFALASAQSSRYIKIYIICVYYECIRELEIDWDVNYVEKNWLWRKIKRNL